ncbi:MAG TPA: hypothetical protein DEP61_05395 [Lachnospiraceae bacterium]|nr:hypothetical protein [Lachnospiraceae bacterium]
MSIPHRFPPHVKNDGLVFRLAEGRLRRMTPHLAYRDKTETKQDPRGSFFCTFFGNPFLDEYRVPFYYGRSDQGETDVSTWNRERHAGADRIKASGG